MLNIFKSPSKSNMILTIQTNQIDLNDPLVKKIQQNLNIEQQEMFIQSFYTYLNCDEEKDFIIDLDNVFKWIGYGRKQECKRLLLNKFEKDIDYVEKSGVPIGTSKNGGQNKQQILMNVKTFKKLCMKADTKKAEKIHDYYIKMEKIMMEHTKELLILQSEKLQLLQSENDQQSQELIKFKELVYEEVDKIEYVYVFTTDKLGVYKIGKTINISGRKSSSNTLLTDDIIIIHQIKTNCCKLVEEVVHFVLDRYRSNSNRELFRCDINYIKSVVNIVGNTVDTLKSSFQTISQEQIFEKLNEKIGTNYTEQQTITAPTTNQNNVLEEPNEFHNWLDKHIKESTVSTDYIELKSICELYLDKENLPSKITSMYKKEIEKYIKEKFPRLNSEYRQHYISDSLRPRGWTFIKMQ